MNNKEAFTAGWNASKRTKTYDLGAAEERFEARHGNTTGSMFAAGWTAYATGELATPTAAWDELMARAEAIPASDNLTPAGVQLAIDAELAQADAEHAPAAAAEAIPDNDRRNRPPMGFVYEMSWGRMEQLVAGAKANQHASTALSQVDYLTEVIQQAELMRARAIDVARQDGESWAAIGAQLGVSKQAAAQRYGKKADA